MSKVDLGNLCVHCRNDTSFGSGRFVNRYPVKNLDVDGNGIEETGYCCDECEQDCLPKMDILFVQIVEWIMAIVVVNVHNVSVRNQYLMTENYTRILMQ